jgi:hypothetical protein
MPQKVNGMEEDDLGPYLQFVADNLLPDQDRQFLSRARAKLAAFGGADDARAVVDMAYWHLAKQIKAGKYDEARPFPNWAGKCVGNFMESVRRSYESRMRNESKARTEAAALAAEPETPESLLIEKEEAERSLKLEGMAIGGLRKKYRDVYDMYRELVAIDREQRKAPDIKRIHERIASKLNILEGLSKVRVLRARAFIKACVTRYPHVPSAMHYFVTMRYAAFTEGRSDHPTKVLESIAAETNERMSYSRDLFGVICGFIRRQLPSRKPDPERIGPLEVRQVFSEINKRLDVARSGQPIREGAES